MTKTRTHLASPTSDKRCGSEAGYQAHAKRGEQPCAECREARGEAAQRRNRARGVKPFKPAECGTPSGRIAHRRRGEEPCEPCLEAVSEYNRARYVQAQRALGKEPRPRDTSKPRISATELARRRSEPTADHRCGSNAGVKAHYQRGELLCQECRDWKRADSLQRARAQGVQPRKKPECGTLSGYDAHRRRGETACEPCMDAMRDSARAHNRARGVKPFKPAECGTRSGYNAHLRRGEKPCDPCREAQKEHMRIYNQKRKLAKAGSASTDGK